MDGLLSLPDGTTHPPTVPRRLGPGAHLPGERQTRISLAAAATHLAMHHGLVELRSFNSPNGARLRLQWEAMHDKVDTLWRTEFREVSGDSMGTIAEAQPASCGHSAQACTNALLASLLQVVKALSFLLLQTDS
jgi:hypothetical protein